MIFNVFLLFFKGFQVFYVGSLGFCYIFVPLLAFWDQYSRQVLLSFKAVEPP